MAFTELRVFPPPTKLVVRVLDCPASAWYFAPSSAFSKGFPDWERPPERSFGARLGWVERRSPANAPASKGEPVVNPGRFRDVHTHGGTTPGSFMYSPMLLGLRIEK